MVNDQRHAHHPPRRAAVFAAVIGKAKNLLPSCFTDHEFTLKAIRLSQEWGDRANATPPRHKPCAASTNPLVGVTGLIPSLHRQLACLAPISLNDAPAVPVQLARWQFVATGQWAAIAELTAQSASPVARYLRPEASYRQRFAPPALQWVGVFAAPAASKSEKEALAVRR